MLIIGNGSYSENCFCKSALELGFSILRLTHWEQITKINVSDSEYKLEINGVLVPDSATIMIFGYPKFAVNSEWQQADVDFAWSEWASSLKGYLYANRNRVINSNYAIFSHNHLLDNELFLYGLSDAMGIMFNTCSEYSQIYWFLLTQSGGYNLSFNKCDFSSFCLKGMEGVLKFLLHKKIDQIFVQIGISESGPCLRFAQLNPPPFVPIAGVKYSFSLGQ